MIYTKVETEKPRISKKRALIIFACVFLGAVILAGSVFGIALAVRNAGYTMSYGGIGLSEGVTNYLVSYYKSTYMAMRAEMSGQAFPDNEVLWNSVIYEKDDGTKYTYGDDLKNYITLSMRSLLASNKVFDTYSKLTSSDKAKIEESVNEILSYRAESSVSVFNENTAKYGYTFADFKAATVMLYKASVAQERICGKDGANMASSLPEMKEYLDLFYNRYSHVGLIFVRTEDEFRYDENGDRIRGEDGNDKLYALDDAAKAERQERIAELNACIAGINSGEVAPQRFFELMEKYDEGDRDLHGKGYYFNSDSSYTKEFSSELESVVKSSIMLKVGEATSVECDFGVCFIYCYEREDEAYTDKSSDYCFSDFYSLAANSFYEELIKEHRENVTVKAAWENVNVIAIPYNNGDYIARF